MKQLATLLLLITLCITSLSAQSLKGKVVNTDGEPVPHAIIFIKELSQGTSANQNGLFDLKLPAGTYHVSFQLLGYQTVQQTVEVAAGSAELQVVLQSQPYLLSETVIRPGEYEDPAYRIMRKAIGMAPFYLNQVSEYKSNVYLKGTLKITKISAVIKATARKQLEETGLKTDQTYLQESVNEVTFKQPAKYTQKVKSVSSTFPQGMGDFYIQQMQFSIYDTKNEMFISPLSPNAFSSYKFKLEGTTTEGYKTVNKIRVIPKLKSKLLVSGYLYIEDDTWNVKEFDLSGETVGVKYRNRQRFAEVSRDVFLPISYLFDFDISILGNQAAIDYKSVVKYSDIKVNPNAKKLAAIQATSEGDPTTFTPTIPESLKKQKLDAKIAELMGKEKLSNSDAMKLADLMSKSADVARKEQQTPEERKKNPLELEPKMKVEVDSLAKKRDTTYWASVRPIPLSTPEVRSYVRRDSIQLIEQGKDSLHRKKKPVSVGSLLLGKRYYFGDSSAYLLHNGLIDAFSLQFNPVDGFSYGQELTFNKRFKDTTSFTATLNGRYAFSRKVPMGSLTVGYRYWPQQRATVTLSGGRQSADFNDNSGIHPIANTYTSLIAHASYIGLYDNTHLSVSNIIDLANGLTLEAQGGFYRYKHLENTTEYSFFYRDHRYRSNDPVNPYLAQDARPLDNQRAAIVSASLSYTPQYYYRMTGKIKRMVRSAYPTITVGWTKGLPNIFNSMADFDLGQLSVKQEINLGLMKSFTYKAEAGKFFNRTQLHFSDFWHPNTQEPAFIFGTPTDLAYYLPRTYQNSTNRWYLSAAAGYETPYLALKYLPFLSNTLWREGLTISYLQMPSLRNYAEVGYNLTGIALVGGLGVYAGFTDWGYTSWGFKVSILLTPPPR